MASSPAVGPATGRVRPAGAGQGLGVGLDSRT